MLTTKALIRKIVFFAGKKYLQNQKFASIARNGWTGLMMIRGL